MQGQKEKHRAPNVWLDGTEKLHMYQGIRVSCTQRAVIGANSANPVLRTTFAT